MRMWIGKEMEGPITGTETLFVETHHLGQSEVEKVLKAVTDRTPKALYLGAGRVDTIYNDKELMYLLSCAASSGIWVTLETSNLSTIMPFAEMLLKYPVAVVHRTEVMKTPQLGRFMLDLVYNKIDDGERVYISSFENEYTTDITGVNEGLYREVDTIIYEEE